MNVPKLRFPEFVNSWKNEKFKDFSYNSGKRNNANLQLVPFAITNVAGFVPQNEAHNEFGYMKNTDRKAYNIVTPNSFAYNPARINVGSIGYYDGNEDIIVSSLYEVFKVKKNLNDKFVWYWLKSEKLPYWINKLQEGSVRQYFYYDKLCETSLYFPTIEEQQKIVSTLELLDKKIELQSKKIEDLKLFKKGLSKTEYAKIKTVNLVRLGDISKIYQPRTLSQRELDNGDYPVFGANGIIGMHSKYNHELSQITISCRGENSGVINKTPDNCWINGNSMVINIDNNDCVIKDYLKIILETQNLKYLISGSGQPQIIRSVVERHVIPLIDINNQCEYCSKFILLDKIINLELLKLNKLQEFKKGLMQNMFV